MNNYPISSMLKNIFLNHQFYFVIEFDWKPRQMNDGSEMEVRATFEIVFYWETFCTEIHIDDLNAPIF